MMMAPINTADRVYTISPTGVTLGALAANSWTGFDSPAQYVFDSGGSRWVGGKTTDPWSDTAFVTKASGRDQEISFKMAQTYQGCTVYLRYDGTSAIVLRVSKGGNVFSANYARYVGRLNQLKEVGNDTYVENVLGMPSGGVSLSALIGSTFALTDVWTFGCSGDTIYAKFNGVTFWSYRFWTHAKPGKIAALFESNASVGYRDVTCTFKPNSVSYSDFDNWVLDPRDWGLKDRKTTGSISSGSYTLTVADATGFEVGDTVCVETGNEAGGGYFGTKGVGGTWPTLSYANAAALPDPAVFRATNNPTDTDLYVWLEDTAKVWINYRNGVGGPPTWGEFSPVTQDYYYYHNEVQPRALITKITAKSGNTLTLAKAASAATTNANVYIDSTPAWEAILSGNARIGTLATSFGATHPDWYSVRENVTIRFPAGQFCLRRFHYLGETRGWTVRGENRDDTILLTPMGGSDFWIKHPGSHNTWHSMTFKGNVIENRGFCHDTDRFYIEIRWALVLSGNRQSGINGEEYARIYNVGFINTTGGAGVELNHYSRIHDCYGIQNEGNLQRYMTWFFATGYCIDAWIENCTYVADKIGTSFELFQAEGGGIRNCTAINGYFSSNFSGGNFLWEDLTAVIDLNKGPTRDWTQSNGAVFNINVNIGVGADTPGVIAAGCRIVRPYIEVTQRVSDGLVRNGIAINNGAVNVRVTGTHPAKPGKGVIKFNKSVAPLSAEYFGIRADNPAVVEGIRVINGGSGEAQTSNIHGHIGPNSSYKNNVTDSIWAINTATSTWYNIQDTNGNITNAEYEALP